MCCSWSLFPLASRLDPTGVTNWLITIVRHGQLARNSNRYIRIYAFAPKISFRRRKLCIRWWNFASYIHVITVFLDSPAVVSVIVRLALGPLIDLYHPHHHHCRMHLSIIWDRALWLSIRTCRNGGCSNFPLRTIVNILLYAGRILELL